MLKYKIQLRASSRAPHLSFARVPHRYPYRHRYPHRYRYPHQHRHQLSLLALPEGVPAEDGDLPPLATAGRQGSLLRAAGDCLCRQQAWGWLSKHAGGVGVRWPGAGEAPPHASAPRRCQESREFLKRTLPPHFTFLLKTSGLLGTYRYGKYSRASCSRARCHRDRWVRAQAAKRPCIGIKCVC